MKLICMDIDCPMSTTMGDIFKAPLMRPSTSWIGSIRVSKIKRQPKSLSSSQALSLKYYLVYVFFACSEEGLARRISSGMFWTGRGTATAITAEPRIEEDDKSYCFL